MRSNEMLKRAVVPTALAMSLGFAACGGDSDPAESANSAVVSDSLNDNEQELASTVCPEGFTMETPISEELALSEVGSPESLFASFTVIDDEGNEALQSTENARRDIIDQTCVKASVLGTLDALFLQTAGFNESGTYTLPDDTLPSVIEDRTNFYRANPGEAVKSLNELASIIDVDGGLVVTGSFNAIAGQATLIAPERTDDGVATQISLKDVPTEGLFTGFQVNYDLDDSNLTEAQKATLEEIAESLVILPNGAILSNQNLGRSSTNFEIVEDAPEEQEVEIVQTPEAPEAPVDVIIREDGTEVPVTTIVTPDGREVPVTIDPQTGEETIVDPQTGEPTGEPVPEGSVPKPADSGNDTDNQGTENGTGEDDNGGGGSNGTNTGDNGGGGGSGGSGDGDCGSDCGNGGGTTTTGPHPTTSVRPTPTTTGPHPTTSVRPTTTRPSTTTTTVRPTTTTSTTTTTTPPTTSSTTTTTTPNGKRGTSGNPSGAPN